MSADTSASGGAGAGGSEGASAPTVGDIAIVLHSHMPYVEGHGTYPFGEEWLFDAALRSYLPVLERAENLTMSVTPVLADQLEDQAASARLRAFAAEYRLDSAIADERDVEHDLRAACLAEAERYERAIERFDAVGGDLVAAFAATAEDRNVELLASTATHAVLPLLLTREARTLQLDAGLRSHRRRFGRSAGIWLPECAYEPGIESLLADVGVEYFCIDQSAHESEGESMRPIATDGALAFPIDWEAIQWLWSWEGYPSDPLYADFHRKSLRGCRPWAIGGDPYDPDAAERRAREQGRRFAVAVADRLDAHGKMSGERGLLTFAIDTELLGHWWWEGIYWLEEALAELPKQGVRAVTLAEARAEHPPRRRELHLSSWGEGKDLRTWDSPRVADLAWAAQRLEVQVLAAAVSHRLEGDALKRVARELLAVQASDWAFLDYGGKTGDYPYQRLLAHSRAAFEALESPAGVDPRTRNLAPDMSPAPLLQP